jgi:hypothetical protein
MDPATSLSYDHFFGHPMDSPLSNSEISGTFLDPCLASHDLVGGMDSISSTFNSTAKMLCCMATLSLSSHSEPTIGKITKSIKLMNLRKW